MRKLPEVEQAKALMTEAMAWSVMKWLREKKKVRKTADEANAALDALDRSVKERWSPEVRTAYNELAQRRSPKAGNNIAADIRKFAERVKAADDEAFRARMEAERTFDEAERRLSTSMARDGCKQAIRSWDLHEKAIRYAED